MAVFQLARTRLRPMAMALTTRVRSSVFLRPRFASSTTAPDYYNILGISKTATQPEIKEAFIKLADQYDDFLDDKSEKFMLIMEAYETLREEESRKEYDLVGKANKDLVGDSAEESFLVRPSDEEVENSRTEGKEGEEDGEDQVRKEKRDSEIREQHRGLFLAAYGLFILISIPKMIIWVIGDPGFRISDWAVRDR